MFEIIISVQINLLPPPLFDASPLLTLRYSSHYLRRSSSSSISQSELVPITGLKLLPAGSASCSLRSFLREVIFKPSSCSILRARSSSRTSVRCFFRTALKRTHPDEYGVKSTPESSSLAFGCLSRAFRILSEISL